MLEFNIHKYLNYREAKVILIGNCNKDSRCLNLAFIKNFDWGEAKDNHIGSARNTERQFVGAAQIGVWIASVLCDAKIMSLIIFTKGRTFTRGCPDRIFWWRRFQRWFEKRRAVMASQEEQKGVGARNIMITTLTRKQKFLRHTDNGRYYLRWKKLAKTKDTLLD